MKAWLKGGLGIFLVLLMITLIWGLVLAIINGGNCSAKYGVMPLIVDAESYLETGFLYCFTPALDIVIGVPIYLPLINSIIRNHLYFAFIFVPLFWFVIGAIIGLIVQKIRSRRKIR